MSKTWITILFIIFLLGAAAAILMLTWIRVRPVGPQQVKQSFTPVAISDFDPSLGSKDAQISIVTFSSFTCPACQRNADVLRQVRGLYPDKVRLIWKDLPDDDTARQLALAARCAQNQGKFWQYHDRLFTQQNQVTDWSLVLLQNALDLKLDQTIFSSCLQDQQPMDLIETNISQGTVARITAVPYSEVNGTIRVDGELSLSEWQAIINKL